MQHCFLSSRFELNQKVCFLDPSCNKVPLVFPVQACIQSLDSSDATQRVLALRDPGAQVASLTLSFGLLAQLGKLFPPHESSVIARVLIQPSFESACEHEVLVPCLRKLSLLFVLLRQLSYLFHLLDCFYKMEQAELGFQVVHITFLFSIIL